MMKTHRTILILAVTLAALLLSLSTLAQDTDEYLEPVVTVAEVQWLDSGEAIEGAEAILTRMEHGLSVTIHAAELEPGHIYTLWWMIFDETENCTDGLCSIDDIWLLDEAAQRILDDEGLPIPNVAQREAVHISALSGVGAVALDDGTAMFRAHRPVGDATGDPFFGTHLRNPMTAEVHIILRTHGPPQPGLETEQLNTPWGGCPDPVDRSPCSDEVVAIFHAPE